MIINKAFTTYIVTNNKVPNEFSKLKDFIDQINAPCDGVNKDDDFQFTLDLMTDADLSDPLKLEEYKNQIYKSREVLFLIFNVPEKRTRRKLEKVFKIALERQKNNIRPYIYTCFYKDENKNSNVTLKKFFKSINYKWDILGNIQSVNEIYKLYSHILEVDLQKVQAELNETRNDINLTVKESIDCRKDNIEFLKSYSHEEDIPKIIDEYEKNMEDAFCYKTDYDSVYDYICFLNELGGNNKALEIGKKLEQVYDDDDNNQIPLANKAKLYSMLSIVTHSIPHMQNETKKYCEKAIAIREELATSDPDKYLPNLANSYNDMGVFYKENKRIKSAEIYYLKAMSIYEKLVYKNSDKYLPDLAGSYSNAGSFYRDQENIDKSEFYYLKAIAIREKLVNDGKEQYESDLAVSYFNYAILKKDTSSFKKAVNIAKKHPDNPECENIIELFNIIL